MNRREFLLGSVSIAAIVTAAGPDAWVSELESSPPIGQLSLNRGFDLGASDTDGISNFSRPELAVTIDSDIEQGADINITVDDRVYITRRLSIDDFNAGGFFQSGPALAPGAHTIGGNVVDRGITT